MAGELRRLNRKDASELSDQLNPSGTLRTEAANPSENETLPGPMLRATLGGRYTEDRAPVSSSRNVGILIDATSDRIMAEIVE
ncbi:hypothetical protein [Mycolicibacterium litorale]|uniref:hypothetical protein n=1 Tax=Mycolicibacterium litorale TaxID=758802 RepID=UPI0010666D72|nr:hypothetical protein [Mycolicibacterium litorale]MCV7417055.1 hypothetical protein [Mycolicibacterium litorale]